MKRFFILPIIAALVVPTSTCAVQLRVKDLASISDGGAHKLIGYGLVVGLQGTGDGKKALFTVQALANMLEEFGLTIDPGQLEVDNVAAVVVTAELPANATVGAKLDVTVSSLGDAKSLQGGTLLLTPLRAADGQVYAIVQGALSIGGYNAGGRGANVRKNHSAVGRVPNGASIVKAISSSAYGPPGGRQLSLQLHQPDFTTAQRLADSINSQLGRRCARALSAGSVQVSVPADCANIMELITRIENVPVEPDMPARVVINERTGTVVIGSQVRILPVAIAHGSLTVKTQREFQVSQPPPLIYEENLSPRPAVTDLAAGEGAGGEGVGDEQATEESPPEDPAVATLAVEETDLQAAAAGKTNADSEHLLIPPLPSGRGRTVVVPKNTVEVEEQYRQLLPVGGEATLEDLVEALNMLGISPRDLIAIIQALKEAGALQAELIIQ